MKIVSCFVNFPFICQWQKEQSSDSPAPLPSMCKGLGKSELLNNHKWNSLIYWSCYSLGKWQCKCRPGLHSSECQHFCLNTHISVAQRSNTYTAHPNQRSVFFPVTCSSGGAPRKPHSSLVYFWTQIPFSWAGSEMRWQKHYPRRKHIHTLCCSVCTW